MLMLEPFQGYGDTWRQGGAVRLGVLLEGVVHRALPYISSETLSGLWGHKGRCPMLILKPFQGY